MSFFEQEVERRSAAPKRRPPWLGPPANVVPVAVPLGLVLAHGQDAAVAVPAVQAYPNGLSLTLVVRIRQRPRGHRAPHGLIAHDPTSDEFVRLGVQFSDGRRATNLHLPRPATGEASPPSPLLTIRGGSGSEGSWDASYWLWPLPTPGPLLIVTEWPAHHLSETSVEVDTGLILEAAAHAVTLWPEDDGSGA